MCLPISVPPANDEYPPEILKWTTEQVGLTPDAFQAELLTSDAKNILVLGGRQTGKSTAAAVRALHEAVHYDESTILLASASGRQSGQILQKTRKLAKQLGLELGPPPPKCDGFTLANGASVVALPDSEETKIGRAHV